VLAVGIINGSFVAPMTKPLRLQHPEGFLATLRFANDRTGSA
jgi:hypothetical protein